MTPSNQSTRIRTSKPPRPIYMVDLPVWFCRTNDDGRRRVPVVSPVTELLRGIILPVVNMPDLLDFRALHSN